MIFKYFKDKDLLVYYSEDDQEWRFCLQNRHSRSKPSKMVEAFWKMCTLTKVTYSHPSITVLGKEFSWLSSQVLDLPNTSFLFSVSPLLVHSKDIQGALVAAWQAHGFIPSTPASSGHILHPAEPEAAFLLLPLWSWTGSNFYMPVFS